MEERVKVRPNIAKRGDKFYVYLKLHGKMKWFPAGTSIRQAQKKLDDLRAERNNGTYQEIKKIRFKAFADLWFESYAKTKVKPSTLRSYKNIIYSHLTPVFEHYRLTDITTEGLQQYIAKRLQTINPRSKRRFNPKTVINELVPLKEMLKHAVRWGYLKSSPAEYVEKPRVEKDEMDVLTPEEINLFLENATPEFRPLFMLAVLTGMRRGEILGLQWGNIDWNHKQIYVKQQLCNTTKKLASPKSRYSIRRIDMTPALARELKRHKLSGSPSELDLVFCGPVGKFLDPDNMIKREYYPALRRAKIRQVRFHDLRHTNVALRIEQGQNIKYIQNQLGHASIQTTLDRYGHLIKEVNTEQAVKLDMALGFMEQSGNLSEKDRQRIDKWGEMPYLDNKKGLTEDRKSLICIGSGERI